ncbi:hypothetical protein [Streptomyces sp. NPDC086777]|uniref:hypothetical protein n=1 Tax=Streptomyces sp. NPDC086777 TaxID=3154866 RepID=UPI00344EDAE8
MAQQHLAVMNHEALADGESADDRHPQAVRAAHQAFDLLRDGLGARLTGTQRS